MTAQAEGDRREPAALEVRPGELTMPSLARLADAPVRITFPGEVWDRIDAAHAVVERVAAGSEPVYGVNTGFGKLATTRIKANEIEELQRRLIVSHMVGCGAPLPAAAVRLTLALKVLSLARGYSGVRRATIAALLRLLEADALPVIPGQGSVGASGDLAPLAHLAGALLGLGAIELAGQRMTADAALARLGQGPLSLGAKEGLALINGTQVSSALALLAVRAAERVAAGALLAGALSVDAVLGSDAPFEARIQKLRGHPHQAVVAARLQELLSGSEIRASHLDCDRVQDPYSLRCQPQVMGPCLELLDDAKAILLREANGVSDNPLVFAADGAVVSGGNFHGQCVAFAADRIALALSEIGSLSERRTALLIDPQLSQLPPFLTPAPGLNSGFMIAQVTAAALASENQHRAAPAGVDSRVTSAGQEDHVSMSTYAARRLLPMTENAARIVAVELLAAAQGIDFRRPLRSSPRLEAAHAALRDHSPVVVEDRPLGPDVDQIASMLLDGRLDCAAF